MLHLCGGARRAFSSSPTAVSILQESMWPERCAQAIAKPETLRDVSNFSEVKQADAFRSQLEGWAAGAPPQPSLSTSWCRARRDDLKIATTSAFATFLLHVQARVASSLGEGFYTIGPCGEETAAAFGIALRETDPCALHYRHVAAQIARQLIISVIK